MKKESKSKHAMELAGLAGLIGNMLKTVLGGNNMFEKKDSAIGSLIEALKCVADEYEIKLDEEKDKFYRRIGEKEDEIGRLNAEIERLEEDLSEKIAYIAQLQELKKKSKRR